MTRRRRRPPPPHPHPLHPHPHLSFALRIILQNSWHAFFVRMLNTKIVLELIMYFLHVQIQLTYERQ